MQTLLVIVWALLVFLSWFGWGAVIGRRFGLGRRLDAGLCTGLGVSVCVVIGGLLNDLKLCSRGMLGAMVLLGAAAGHATRDTRRAPRATQAATDDGLVLATHADFLVRRDRHYRQHVVAVVRSKPI